MKRNMIALTLLIGGAATWQSVRAFEMLPEDRGPVEADSEHATGTVHRKIDDVLQSAPTKTKSMSRALSGSFNAPSNVLLIEDQSGFGNAATVLSDEGFSVTEIFNEYANRYANLLNTSFMSQFSHVVYGERGNGGGVVMPQGVAESLEAYIQQGGNLLVTGYDTLGSPEDIVLANLVRAINPRDAGTWEPVWQVEQVENFFDNCIINGPYGDFRGLTFRGSIPQDEDITIPDISAGTIKLVSTTDTVSKIITNNAATAGTVTYWNGGLSGTSSNAQPDFSDGGPPQQIFLNWVSCPPVLAPIDINFCINPNDFNCSSTGGVVPMTVFGTDELNVENITIDTVQLCLADASACLNTTSLHNHELVNRGNPDTDLGASDCSAVIVDDGRLDLDLEWEANDIVETLLGGCDNVYNDCAGPSFVFVAATTMTVPVRSIPTNDPGIDQLFIVSGGNDKTDECNESSDDCVDIASCVNIECGSYTCICPNDYVGDGKLSGSGCMLLYWTVAASEDGSVPCIPGYNCDCIVNGTCIYSHADARDNWDTGAPYRNYQNCFFTLINGGQPNGSLNVEELDDGTKKWEVEDGFDFLRVLSSGVQRASFTGTSFPVNFSVSANEVLHWETDSFDTLKGFGICVMPLPTSESDQPSSDPSADPSSDESDSPSQPPSGSPTDSPSQAPSSIGACCLEGKRGEGRSCDDIPPGLCSTRGGAFLGAKTSCDDEDGDNICKAVKPCGEHCLADLQCKTGCCLTPDRLRFGRKQLSASSSKSQEGKCTEAKWCRCYDAGGGFHNFVTCVDQCSAV